MLAGHETVSKTVSRPNALSHGMSSDNPRFADDICIMGAREATRDPAQAPGGSYKDVQDDQGTRKR
jgi:hypothetical protein